MGAYLCKDAEHAKQAKQETSENAMLPASEKLKNQDKDVVVDGENPDIPFADATGDEDENVEAEKNNESGKVVNDYNKSSVENQESPVLLSEVITVDLIKNVENAPSLEEGKHVDAAHEDVLSPEVVIENDLIVEDLVVEVKENCNENLIETSDELKEESIEKVHNKCDMELDNNQINDLELLVDGKEIKTEEIVEQKTVEPEEAICDEVKDNSVSQLETETIQQTAEESEEISNENETEMDKIVHENEELQHQLLENVDDKTVEFENVELEIIEKEDNIADDVEEIENSPKVSISCENIEETEAPISELNENNESDIKDDSISNADEMILEPEFVESEKESSPEIKELEEVCNSNINADEVLDKTFEQDSSEIKEHGEFSNFNISEVSEKESSECKEHEEVSNLTIDEVLNETNQNESLEIKEIEEACDSNVTVEEIIVDETNEKESSEIHEPKEAHDSNVEEINDEVVLEKPTELDEQNFEKEEGVNENDLLSSEEHKTVDVIEKQESKVSESVETEESNIDNEQREQDYIPNESTPETFESTEPEKTEIVELAPFEDDVKPTLNEVENEPVDIQSDNIVLESTSNEELVKSSTSEEVLTEIKMEEMVKNIENQTEELLEARVSVNEKEPVDEESILDKFTENSIVDIDLSTQNISTNGNVTSEAHESDDQSISNEIEIENGVEDVKDEELKKMVSDAVDEIMGDAKSQVQHIVESPSSKDSSINVLES